MKGTFLNKLLLFLLLSIVTSAYTQEVQGNYSKYKTIFPSSIVSTELTVALMSGISSETIAKYEAFTLNPFQIARITRAECFYLNRKVYVPAIKRAQIILCENENYEAD